MRSIDFSMRVRYNKHMMKNYYEQPFNVRYCDVDFKDELKPSSVLAYFEEAASYSADFLGFGYHFIKPRNLAFVVMNVRCEFLRPLHLFEKDVCVRTWPLQPSYAAFGREYLLCAGEETVVKASSRWCLIDLTTGKIAPSKVIDNQDYSTYNTRRALEVERWKIPAFPLEEGEEKFSLTIANSEYDHNFHVNNTRYADYCFNVFSVEELKTKRLCSFSISYVKQCCEGDKLTFYRRQIGVNEYLVQGVNQHGEVVTQAEICFV